MKHAILILTHGDLTVTKWTMKLLDDERFSFFIHLDKKNKDSGEELLSICRRAEVFLTERVAVYWAHYSMIEAELILLKAALRTSFDYCHLVSGADLPICTPDEFDVYFSQRQRKEYIHSWGEHPLYWKRINYRYPLLTKYKRSSNRVVNILRKIMYTRVAKIRRKKSKHGGDIRLFGGDQWFSLTKECAEMICSQECWIKDTFSNGYTVDELFAITLIMNDEKWKIRHSDEITRLIDWNRGKPYVWCMDDLDQIMASNAVFCRKFDPAVDADIIEAIGTRIMTRKCSMELQEV